jgi:hypothetical protein
VTRCPSGLQRALRVRPEQPRHALADYIRSRGTFRNLRVEATFRTVSRHLFLPGVDLVILTV